MPPGAPRAGLGATWAQPGYHRGANPGVGAWRGTPTEALPMPVLPLIDLMIFLAWTSLIVGFVLKLMQLALARPFGFLGMGPFDFAVLAAVALLFAISLAARVWVKATEPGLLRRARGRADEALPDFPDPREQVLRGDEEVSLNGRDRIPAR